MSTIKIIEDISWCFKWLTHSLGKKVKKWAQDCGPNFRDCSFFDTQFRSKTFCDFMDRNLVKVHKPREKKNVVNIQVCLVTKRVIICRIRHRFLHDKAGFTAQDFLVLGLSLKLHWPVSISCHFPWLPVRRWHWNCPRKKIKIETRKLVPVSLQLCATSDFMFCFFFSIPLETFKLLRPENLSSKSVFAEEESACVVYLPSTQGSCWVNMTSGWAIELWVTTQALLSLGAEPAEPWWNLVVVRPLEQLWNSDISRMHHSEMAMDANYWSGKHIV